MDGGTGTEIERRGGRVNDAAWSSESLLTHPDIVREVHVDFIRAGAEIIIANSFSTSRHLLEAAGLQNEFETMNRRAVELALEAREAVPEEPESIAAIKVAGSISTTTMGREQPPADTARRNFDDQAQILASAGADLLILEMMRDVEYTGYAVEAAMATGLPVWVGFSAYRDKQGDMILVDGKTPLSEGIDAIDPGEIEVAGIMHTLTDDISASLSDLEEFWSGPSLVYAHSGLFEMPNWRFTDIISPTEYADHAVEWVERGVTVIGGCCGIGPEHIAVLRERLRVNRG